VYEKCPWGPRLSEGGKSDHMSTVAGTEFRTAVLELLWKQHGGQ
jgi:hypothetical protein